MAMEKMTSPPPQGTHTEVAVAGHPLHPMLVTFPIAFLLGALGSDVAFWYTADPFWARMSLWLLGGGTVMGALAGLAGTVELLAISGIRLRGASWSHFVAAVMLLSVACTNWLTRLDDPTGAVLPFGLYLSALGALLVAIAGWLGGTLVFEHRVGIVDEDGD
jgi:uncharacterized membrane protein